MEIAYLIMFFLMGGGAILVGIIMFAGIFNRKHVVKPYGKWTIVVLLSIIQESCWGIGSSFNGAFGNHGEIIDIQLLFALIVIVWFGFQFYSHFKYLDDSNNTNE